MRVYYLRLTETDFTLTGDGKWKSSVIDLYDNDSYRNFSNTKATYGIFGQRRTWIGTRRKVSGELQPLSRNDIDTILASDDLTIETDSGVFENGRFIDCTGRIDVISFKAVDLSGKLEVFTSSTSDGTYYREEWVGHLPRLTSEPINIIDSDRYAIFEFTPGADTPTEGEILVRVEIDAPIIAPLFRSTRILLDKFPQWTQMHEDSKSSIGTDPNEFPYEFPFTLYNLIDQDIEVAQTESVGGSFLNAIAGEWLEDLRRELSYREFQKYIDTVDLDQMAWAYRAELEDLFVYSVEGDGTELTRAADAREFRESKDEPTCYIDFDEGYILVNQLYNTFKVNGVSLELELFHVWNYLDEVGLFVDLDRLPAEDNESYQTRIKDVYINRGGVGVESLKLALRRELNIWKAYGATPNSSYAGATPTILSFEDIENDPLYFDPDGMPTKKFVEFAQDLAKQFPTTWGHFIWDRALWDVAGRDNQGYGVLPYRYDATPVDDAYVQSGVGDGNDLFVFEPSTITGPRDFTAKLKVRGRKRSTRTEYPPVTFSCSVFGYGDFSYWDHPAKSVWYTLEVELKNPLEPTYICSFLLSATSDVDDNNSDPTPASYVYQDLFSDIDNYTAEELSFVDPDTNVPYGSNEIGATPYEGATPSDEGYEGRIPIDEIKSITLRQGKWEAGEYGFIENEDHFEAWFTSDDAQVLSYDTVEDDLPNLEVTGSNVLDYTRVAMKSLLVGDNGIMEQYTEKYHFDLTVNGGDPTSQQPLEFSIPNLVWPPGLDNRGIALFVTSYDPESVYQPTLEELENADPHTFDAYDDVVYGIFREEPVRLFMPIENLYVNGDNTWIDDEFMTFSDDTTSITFSVAPTIYNDDMELVYPIDAEVWEGFEAEDIIFYSGVVDENGPWRNGQPAAENSTNYLFEVVPFVKRSDFNIPDTDDYVITWIGVESDNDRVITWLDSNAVVPVADSGVSDPVYPANAWIEKEDEDTGSRYLEQVAIRARIRSGPDAQWSPQVHSGYLYDKNDEYYLYAKPIEVTATTSELTLTEPPRQGAPVAVWTEEATPKRFRQVAFIDEATPTNVALSLTNTEIVSGSGVNKLFAGYRDIYDITVTNLSTGQSVGVTSTSTTTNIVTTTTTTNRDHEYEVTYKVNNSFYVDYDVVTDSGNHTGKIYFDKAPADLGVASYKVSYETSEFDPATPVGVALNPLYTIQDHGFLYVSFNEYTLESLRARVHPAQIVWDGQDYLMITLQSLDQHGNPKPNQTFTLSSEYGVLDKESVTTNVDGFASAVLRARGNEAPNPSLEYNHNHWYAENAFLKRSHDTFLYDSFSLEAETASDGDVVISTELLPVSAFATHYAASLYALQDSTAREIEPSLTWYNSDQQVILTDFGDSVEESGTTDWVRLSVISEKPDNAAFYKVDFTYGSTEGEIHYFDGLLIEPTDEVLEYFDDHNHPNEGTLSVVGDTLSAELRFKIHGVEMPKPQLYSAVKVDQLTADGVGHNYVYGVIEDESLNRVSGVTVYWKKARSLYDLFSEDGYINESGSTTTESDGSFLIGPFEASEPDDPGFWFVAVEAVANGYDVGDVVFWLESPTLSLGVETHNPSLPITLNQHATPISYWPPYAYGKAHPTVYDEHASPLYFSGDATINWLPPLWMNLSEYKKYQLGIEDIYYDE